MGKFNSFEKGYNCTIGGSGHQPEQSGSNKNRKLSKEHKEKLHNSVKKKVWQFDLEGNFITEFESCAEASSSFGPQDNASGISQCCNNRKGCVKGYQWRWPGEYPGNMFLKNKTQKIWKR